MLILLFFLAIFGGFVSGLIGVGGAVVMIPLMLTIPPFFGFEPISMKTIAGLSMLQAFFAALSGMLIHRKNKFVHTPTLLTIGIPMGIASLIGSYSSQFMNDKMILAVFGLLVLVAFLFLVFDKAKNDKTLEEIKINYTVAALLGALVGLATGVVGAGGGFIMIPLMIVVLKIPLKITVGTSLGIIFINALSGSLGKILSFQVEYYFVIPIVIGASIGAPLGAYVSKLSSPKLIKAILLSVIFLNWIQVGVKLFK
jgi:uncharacterized membrane protein YfcA